jgi:hypothetical protein
MMSRRPGALVLLVVVSPLLGTLGCRWGGPSANGPSEGSANAGLTAPARAVVDAARSYCLRMQECDPQWFAEAHRTVDACANEDVEMHVGAACIEANRVYNVCLAALSCPQFLEEEGCASEGQAYEAACGA